MRAVIRRAIGASLLTACLLALTASLGIGVAAAQTTLRMTWYSDGNEGEVMADLLRRFEDKHPDIHVVLDQVPFKAINENLPVQLASGQGPDIARVADMGGLARYMLDLRPYLKDAAYWEANYGPFLQWMRVPGDTSSIPGFMTQLTVTGPFVNKTLFEQAGVAMPGPRATWEDWAKATKEVAAKVQAPFPIAFDRSGHRFFGMAISEGAAVFDDKGNPAVIDDGFKRAAKLIFDWHNSGVMSKELWGSVAGATYRGANEEFKNAQVVMYESGSWQISQFDKTIGAAFDWVAVPTPCGPANCSGMPGGAALVGIKSTKHPEEVARVLDYLASEDVVAEFYARSLFVPGHLGLARKGLDYKDASPVANAALKVFSDGVNQLAPAANQLQGYPASRVILNAVISRLGQAVSGEITLDDSYKRIAGDIEQQLAERNKK
ncbi:carbohydrate ABC transporter substrate-binding protein [Bradyrhizobium manausense]|uniref:ABC transporter substrate-binding protein n=1 Tax=Bradyrhizobium manausense TaxID=989370 RepID=UPI001BA91B44|nr:ABC transporter substrate-binding protein [Bradyrhizobium manausense]MBR0833463.1 carbohydrate ABC transporter substrate-binding protein [Bradyrhizobium manausense]